MMAAVVPKVHAEAASAWPVTDVALVISGVLLAGAVLLGVWRVYRGPHLPDRVVALDLLGTLCVGGCVVIAIAAGEVANLLVAMVMALLLFVSTLAASHFLLTTRADRRAKAAGVVSRRGSAPGAGDADPAKEAR